LADTLLASTRLKTFPAGTRLCAIGDGPGAMFFLAHGCLEAEVSPSVMPPHKCLLLYPGAWIGEGAVTTTARRVGLLSTRPSSVLMIEGGDVRRVASTQPDLWRHLAILALENHYRTMGLAHDLMIRGGRRRFAAILARLAGLREDPVPDQLVIDATQAEVADIANLARSVVSTFVQELDRDGVVRPGWGTIEVLRPDLLLQRAEDNSA
jgi:CRP-like cAMP-binding protein